jgi:hypothetical protein
MRARGFSRLRKTPDLRIHPSVVIEVTCTCAFS